VGLGAEKFTESPEGLRVIEGVGKEGTVVICGREVATSRYISKTTH
jgi:hypothetical protein